MSENSIFKKSIKVLLLTLLMSAIFNTANAEKERKGPPKGKPPAEAFSACSNQAEESACSFNNADGKAMEGICKVPRKEEASLVCKPNRSKHKGKRERNRD